jgi:hypothetical protein
MGQGLDIPGGEAPFVGFGRSRRMTLALAARLTHGIVSMASHCAESVSWLHALIRFRMVGQGRSCAWTGWHWHWRKTVSRHRKDGTIAAGELLRRDLARRWEYCAQDVDAVAADVPMVAGWDRGASVAASVACSDDVVLVRITNKRLPACRLPNTVGVKTLQYVGQQQGRTHARLPSPWRRHALRP